MCVSGRPWGDRNGFELFEDWGAQSHCGLSICSVKVERHRIEVFFCGGLWKSSGEPAM